MGPFHSSRTLLFALTALAAVPAYAATPPVGYAQATGYFKQESRPTLYQPLNLLDAREATVWCTTTADNLADQLSFGFKGPARVDEIRIYTGNGSDDSAFEEFARGKKFTFKSPNNAYNFTVADQRGLQAFQVDPPLVGSFLSVDIVEQYQAEDPESPVCVTDIVFYSEGKALNGSWMTQRLKYDRNRAQVLGTWFGGYEGAPDRFLSFFFDGTFRLTHEPYEGKPSSLTGSYTLNGTRLTMDLGSRGRFSGRLEREKIEGDPLTPESERRTIKFGDNAPEALKVGYRDVR